MYFGFDNRVKDLFSIYNKILSAEAKGSIETVNAEIEDALAGTCIMLRDIATYYSMAEDLRGRAGNGLQPTLRLLSNRNALGMFLNMERNVLNLSSLDAATVDRIIGALKMAIEEVTSGAHEVNGQWLDSLYGLTGEICGECKRFARENRKSTRWAESLNRVVVVEAAALVAMGNMAAPSVLGPEFALLASHSYTASSFLATLGVGGYIKAWILGAGKLEAPGKQETKNVERPGVDGSQKSVQKQQQGRRRKRGGLELEL